MTNLKEAYKLDKKAICEGYKVNVFKGEHTKEFMEINFINEFGAVAFEEAPHEISLYIEANSKLDKHLNEVLKFIVSEHKAKKFENLNNINFMYVKAQVIA